MRFCELLILKKLKRNIYKHNFNYFFFSSSSIINIINISVIIIIIIILIIISIIAIQEKIKKKETIK